MPWPTYIHYSGYHSPRVRPTNSADYMGRKGERVCIHLSKPFGHRSLKIEKEEEASKSDLVDFCRKSPPYVGFPCRVAGTLSKNNVLVYTNSHKFMKDPQYNGYEGVGFTDKLKVTNSMDTVRSSTIDMAEVLESVEEENDDRFNISSPPQKKMKKMSSFEVQCVVQAKCKGNILRFQKEQIAKKLSSLNGTQSDDTLWNLVCNRLPVDLYEDILKHMDFDQVRWLAEEKEKFARLLAFTRYKLDAYNSVRYPSISHLLPAMRTEARKEIRFSSKDDMWIASISVGGKKSGIAKRLRMTEGVYSWSLAASMTSLTFDMHRSKCDQCSCKYSSLLTAMDENQVAMLTGQSRLKFLLLNGSEHETINSSFACPFYDDSVEMSDIDYNIHLWTDSLENRWLVDLKNHEGTPLDMHEYLALEQYKTLIFKDPVRFFGTSKIISSIDVGIMAISSERTGETLGYLVEDECIRYRVPQQNENLAIIGLCFLPTTMYRETLAIYNFVVHIRYHEITEQIKHLSSLTIVLAHELLNPLRDINEILQEIDVAHKTRTLLQQKINNKDWLTMKLFFEERRDKDTVRIQETFEEGFKFSTKYSFNALGESLSKKVMKLNADFMFRCPFEEEEEEEYNLSSTCIINPNKLHMIYITKMKQQF